MTRARKDASPHSGIIGTLRYTLSTLHITRLKHFMLMLIFMQRQRNQLSHVHSSQHQAEKEAAPSRTKTERLRLQTEIAVLFLTIAVIKSRHIHMHTHTQARGVSRQRPARNQAARLSIASVAVAWDIHDILFLCSSSGAACTSRQLLGCSR